MTGNNPNLDLVNINAQNLVKCYQLVPKILSVNEILTSVKGHNSATNVPKMICKAIHKKKLFAVTLLRIFQVGM